MIGRYEEQRKAMGRSRLLWTPLLLCAVVVCWLVTSVNAEREASASFPLQFTATVEIVSHLIDEDSDYPPRSRRMAIYYDFINKRARVEIEAGYEAAKFYIRRYDTKNEYMVRLPPIDDCKRSYLGEDMPLPDLSTAEFVEKVEMEGTVCNYFLHSEYDIRVHIYIEADAGIPIKLIQENVKDNGTSVPLLTYTYKDVVLGPPDSSWFELPPSFSHQTCTRHIGGFPYLHVFHYFVKF